MDYTRLTREQLITHLEERDEGERGGIRLTYTGQTPPWRIVRRVYAKNEGIDKGAWPKLYFGTKGTANPMLKLYRDEVKAGSVPNTFWVEEGEDPLDIGSTSWAHSESGRSREGIEELTSIVGQGHGFETVKPLKLFKKIVQIWCPFEGVVMDPFAGSGTTAHAVLELNRESDASRRFVLVEQGRPNKRDDYARTLTAVRVTRAITGERPDKDGKAAKPAIPLPGGFRFSRLSHLVDSDAVLALEREEMIDLLITSHWDQGDRSSTVFRFNPIPTMELTSPGEGAHPGPLPPHLSNEPVVGVVDGGRTARSYEESEAWRVPALVPDGAADHKHGNRVTALVVHGHAWNTNLPLPELFCRVGTVQAVPKAGANYPPDPQRLVSYLERSMAAHRDTRVWNMSFNEILPCDPDQVSFLGHEIARLARTYDVLPVISAGNRSKDNQHCIAPPADCEAALVVAGRKSGGDGQPGDPCDVSLPGPGPEGMLKPDLSWYSTVRIPGEVAAPGGAARDRAAIAVGILRLAHEVTAHDERAQQGPGILAAGRFMTVPVAGLVQLRRVDPP